MNFDDWRAHDPQDDEDYRMPLCATQGCETPVTFPDEVYCSACLVRHAQQRKALQEQMELQEVRVRR